MSAIIHDSLSEWRADVLEELGDDLRMLLTQRAALSVSPDTSLAALARHDRRISGTLDALVLADHQSIPFVLAALDDEDRASGIAASLVLGLQGSEASRTCLQQAWCSSEDAARDGLRLGLSLLHATDRALATATPTSVPHVAACTAWLRVQDGILPETESVQRWLSDASCAVRALGFRIVASCGGPRQARVLRSVFSEADVLAALTDPDVAPAALEAALVWHGAWALSWAREELRTRGANVALAGWVLAGSGDLADVPAVLESRVALGTARYVSLLGIVGDVRCGDRLLEIVQSEDDPVSAAMAGQALTRMTGIDSEREQRLPVPPESAKEPDEDFSEEIRAVDAERAGAAWSVLKRSLSARSRVRHGLDLAALEGPWPVEIDMELRTHQRVREVLQGSENARVLECVGFMAPLTRGP